MDTFMKFLNIEEIKFIKVRDNIFSVSIKSDIEKDNINLKDTVFESQLCKIDSTLELKFGREYTDVSINDDFIIKSETYSIPIEIKLLLNKELNEIFRISFEKKK
jgi:hypothetical protein